MCDRPGMAFRAALANLKARRVGGRVDDEREERQSELSQNVVRAGTISLAARRRRRDLHGCHLQRYKMRGTTFIMTCMAIFGWVSPSYAVPVVPPDPPMSAERIAHLPSEIRTIVLARCGAGAEAGHYFATYDDNSYVVRLDYSLLQCPKAPEHCEGSSCVQTFVRLGGKYVLSQSRGNHSSWLDSRRDLSLQ